MTSSDKSSRIRQRHIAVDVLAITLGSFIVDAVSHRSWVSGLIAVALSIPLYVLDREGVENEESKA